MIELIGRFIRWFVHLIGIVTLLRLVLLALTLFCIEHGIIAIVGHLRQEWLTSTVVYALLVGWSFGRSRLSGWVSGLLVTLIGLFWLALSIGQLSAPLDLVVSTLPPILKSYIFRAPPDFGPLLVAWSVFMQSLQGLTARLMLWLQNAGTSTLIVDPGITSLVWGLALWLVSLWAAWWVRRKEALGVALLPATTLLIYNVYYTNSSNGIYWLVLTGGGWIFLQALESHIKARRRWHEQHMGQTDIEPLLGLTILLVATGLMLAGGLIPSVSIQKISDTLQHVFKSRQDNKLAESLGLQQTPVFFPQGGSGPPGISETHAVGPGPQLTQEIMLFVTVEGYEPPPPPDVILHINLVQPEQRYYWRSQVFDAYNGHVWVANTALIQSLAANAPYHPDLIALPKNYRVVRQHIERLQPLNGALFVTGDLLTTDQISTAAWRATGDLIDARTNANSYLAESRIQSLNVNLLRQAGNNYPASVHNYLSLPDELPERVRDLAVRLTINQPTPYDQVMAIQDYLRQFPYSLQVPGSPTNRDVADFFLFDLQKGYCDYFATTMAVMVRAVGIPSRLVTGFSSGSYDYTSDRFIVVQSNAHSWVEVFFPGIGWVEFEPTTNQLPFTRPGETGDQSRPASGIPPLPPLAESRSAQIDWSKLRNPLVVVEFILVGLVVLLLAWSLLPIESWLLRLRTPDKAISAIHLRLYRQGHVLGLLPDASRTPHEFAGAFTAKLERYAGNHYLAPFTASLQADVNWLTALYTCMVFGPHPPTRAEQYQAVQKWAHIRKGLRKIRYS